MTTRAFTTTELAALNVPPDSPDDVEYSDVLLADEAVTTLKYSQQRRCVFRADDGQTYAVTYETDVDSGDYEHGPAPENHGWLNDSVEAVLVAQQPVTELRWLPAEVPPPAAPSAPANRAVLRAAAWFESEGRAAQTFFGHQAAAELRRMADARPAAEPPAVSWEARAHQAMGLYTQAARQRDDLAHRVHAVDRLCSGRPGYHVITVKALLTAMSEAVAPTAGERGTCSACHEPAVRYALGGWSHSLRYGCGDGEPVVAEFVPASDACPRRGDAGDRQEADDFQAWLKAQSEGNRDDLLRAAAKQLRCSSPAVAAHTVFVKIPPAAADALADLLDMSADARGRFPYEVFIVARRLLDATEGSEPSPRAER